MRPVAVIGWLPLLLAIASSPQAAQCKFAGDTRDAVHVRVELFGSGEFDDLEIEMSREGGDLKTFPANVQDEVWVAKPTGSPFRICEVNLFPFVAGYEIQGPTDCGYEEYSPEGAAGHWDARYIFHLAPLDLVLEVEPPDAAFYLREWSRHVGDGESECLPDVEAWRLPARSETKVRLAIRGANYQLELDEGSWEPSIETLAKELYSAAIPYATRNKGQAVSAKRALLAGVEAVRFQRR